MSAGNSLAEAHVQCLSEIFERAVKKHIIANEIILPDVPQDVLNKYSSIVAGIEALEQNGFSVLIKDASLGGQFPVICVTLMNPKTGGVFASFGAHPKFEVALERSLTELLQGRSFAGLDDVPKPTFNSMAVSDAENFIEHFIDSTGVISWRFFSDQANFAFSAWDFSGTTTEEAEYLFTILKNQGNQVYVANYHDLGGIACRIIVPGYSEIYPIEDLIWNNTNVALDFREDILTIHALNDTALANLLQRLEDSQIDDYMVIRTLIGIEFDENTVWGQLTIVELKLLICLALQDLEQAKDCVEQLLQYNDNTTERNLFFQAVDTVLAIQLNENLNLKHYLTNLKKIFGAQTLHNVLGSVDGSIKFYGLFATSMQLEGIDKHLRLLASYKKIHHARKRFHATLNTEN